MSKDTNKSKLHADWFSDSDDTCDSNQNITPTRKILRNATDSEASSPDSPVVWNYNLPVVNQETKDAAEKLDLGIRAWKRKRRRSLLDSSPTSIRFKKDFFITKLRIAGLSEKTTNETVDNDKKKVEDYSLTNASKQDIYKKELFSKSIHSEKENLLSDENDLLFLEVDLNNLPNSC